MAPPFKVPRLAKSNAEKTSGTPADQEKSAEDHLSNMHLDCLLDVCSRLDHNDLNQLAVTSGAMSALANSARQTARKVEAEYLNIKVSQCEKEIYIAFNDGEHEVFDKALRLNFSHAHCEICEDVQKSCKNSPDHSLISAIHELFEIAGRAMRKFKFNSVHLDINSSIDAYADLCARYLDLSEQEELVIKVYSGGEKAEVLKKWIIDSGIARLEVKTIPHDIFDIDFLCKYAEAVPEVDLEIEPLLYDDRTEVNVPSNALPLIATYRHWAAEHFVIKAEKIMDFILMRRTLPSEGHFVFRTSAALDSATLQAALEPGMTVQPIRNGTTYEILNSDKKCIVKLFINDDLRVSVKFMPMNL